MKEFKIIKSKAMPMPYENVDTDQIMPARFLLRTEKEGYGDLAFYDWRYDEKGKEKKDFILNKPAHKGAKIMIAGDNFGCGSSREHAVWGLVQSGIRAVISTSFGPIFRNNAYGHGLLTIEVSKKIQDDLFKKVKKNSDYQLTIDLPKQKIITEDGEKIDFDIDSFYKNNFIKGMDNIDYVLSRVETAQGYSSAPD